MSRVVLIDVDLPWSLMEKYELREILNEKINFCLSRFNIKAKFVNITQSQCGNVHVHIITYDDIDPKIAIKLKFCVGEDSKRLRHSIRRFEKLGKLLDFFWVRKVKECKDEGDENE